jgi:hypothetical protein
VAVLEEAVAHQEKDQNLGQGARHPGGEEAPVGAVGQAPLEEGRQEESPGRLELYSSEVLWPDSEGEGEAQGEESGGKIKRDTDPSFPALALR